MNFKRLIEYLNLENSEFFFQFESHPNFPSALAFSDTLNFFGVKNDAYELEKDYWHDLPDEFITISNGSFALIKKDRQRFKVFSEDVRTISKDELYNNSTDFVILYENELQTKPQKSFSYKNWVYAIMVLLLLYSLFQKNWYESIFSLFSIAGIYISLELFNKKFGQNSIVVDNICGGRTSDLQSSCSKIIDSDRIDILGLKISDFSLAYFVGILLLGIFLPATGVVLKVISAMSILVILYSLYIQVFVEKAFCKICLVILTILLFQIAVAQLYFLSIISVNTVVLSILALIISFIGLAFINDILHQREEFKKSNLKNYKFKRNFDLFKRELLSTQKIHFKYRETGFYLGKKAAKLHITLISNPYCSYCKDAHIILKNLLEKYPDDISAEIRFNFSEIADQNYTFLMSEFISIYNNKSQNEFLRSVDSWYENKDLEKLKEKNNSESQNINLQSAIEIGGENKYFGFNFTPIFLINGFAFPDKYDREDIFYFIDELLEDEEIIK